MPLLLLLVTLIVQSLGSWTLAYHLALLFGLLPWQAGILFLGILLPVLAITRGYWVRAIRCSRHECLFAIGVVGLGAAFGCLALCVDNYNPDDYGFFHRALVQVNSPGRSFLIEETGLRPAGLPPSSILHAMTSYELAVAFTSHLVGADPLWCYQNGMGFLSVLLMSVGVALLNRQFRLGAGMALLATLASFLFMISDARDSRSFGDLLWYGATGKDLLYGVLLPWTILLALRFLRRPRVDRFLPLVCCGACGIGLTGSGLFLIPMEIFFVSVAYLFQSLPWIRTWSFLAPQKDATFAERKATIVQLPFLRRFRRALLVNIASVYCVAIVALSLAGVIRKPSNIEIWLQGWPTVWWLNLGLIWATPALVVRDALLVLLLPLFALRRPFGRLAGLLGIALIVFVANPLAGPLWMRAVEPGAFWRFIYLLPLMWYAGLIVPALSARRKRLAATVANRMAAVLAIVAMAVASRSVIGSYTARSSWHFKSPLQLRLPHNEADFARLAIPHLQGRYILGPINPCICIALLSPGGSGFDSMRSTEHFLANVGRAEEGRLRVLAQEAVTQGDVQGNRAGESTAAIRQALDRGVDAVIFLDTEPVRRLVVPQLAERGGNRWQLSVAGFGYVLYLRQAPSRQGASRQ